MNEKSILTIDYDLAQDKHVQMDRKDDQDTKEAKRSIAAHTERRSHAKKMKMKRYKLLSIESKDEGQMYHEGKNYVGRYRDGIYFTTNIGACLNSTHKKIGEVIIPENVVYTILDDHTMRSPCIHLFNIRDLTYQDYKKAVSQHGSALQYVPENMKTPEIILHAIDNDPSAIQYVPKGTKTIERSDIVITLRGYKKYQILTRQNETEQKGNLVCYFSPRELDSNNTESEENRRDGIGSRIS
jgi:hypothetical protein